ncbi:MAG: glycosyl hydrolase family 18 protein [Bacteroidota bacterium]
MKIFLIFSFFLLPFSFLQAQSIHELQQKEAESFKGSDFLKEKILKKDLRDIPLLKTEKLTKKVFGWNPYWMDTAYKKFDYSTLSTVGYFSYEVDTATGSYSTVRFWKTTQLIPIAHAAGTKVVLTVTNFGNANNQAVLKSPKKRRTMIDSLVSLVKLRNADGVNIDFEAITDQTLRDSLTIFLKDLSVDFHTKIPGSEVSIALPAVDWSRIFDVLAYEKFLDYALIMGYDYHWSTSPIAGPVAPLKSSSLWGANSVTKSVETYLSKGISPQKLLLAVPYYGFEWPTDGKKIRANTTGPGKSYTYANAEPRAQQFGKLWDDASQTPYYKVSEFAEGWYDDRASLALKYDLILEKNLGGVGIWALGYDGDKPELNELLKEKFGSQTNIEDDFKNDGFVKFSASPNPFLNSVSIHCNLFKTERITIQILNMRGQEIAQVFTGELPVGEHVFKSELSNFAAGVYAVRFLKEDSAETIFITRLP